MAAIVQRTMRRVKPSRRSREGVQHVKMHLGIFIHAAFHLLKVINASLKC